MLFLAALAFVQPLGHASVDQNSARQHQLGREVAVSKHLRDDEEFRIPLPALIAHGKLLFSANWTEQEGA